MVAIDGDKIATFARPRGVLDALPLGGSSFTPREVILTSEFQARGERLVVPIEEAKLHLGSYKTLPEPGVSWAPPPPACMGTCMRRSCAPVAPISQSWHHLSTKLKGGSDKAAHGSSANSHAPSNLTSPTRGRLLP